MRSGAHVLLRQLAIVWMRMSATKNDDILVLNIQQGPRNLTILRPPLRCAPYIGQVAEEEGVILYHVIMQRTVFEAVTSVRRARLRSHALARGSSHFLLCLERSHHGSFDLKTTIRQAAHPNIRVGT